LKTSQQLLDLSIIESCLATRIIGRPSGSKNELWEQIDSTNSRALVLAQEGAAEGVLVLAHSQNAGRGRLGRRWLSPKGAGLYLSVLLRPERLMAGLPLITIASGLAAAMAVEITTGIRLQLKWVNDLVSQGRKVGGILAELQTQPLTNKSEVAGFHQALVVGIGINISSKGVELPQELSGKVQWLEDIAPQSVDRNLLVSQIAYELEQALNLIWAGQTSAILDAWRCYSATLGETVKAEVGDSMIEGLAVDITDSGALLVKTTSGMHELHAGEVSIRRSDGSYC
jgi:BirA family biotin operon repressor/biotin-[acetyl-CoA-carboxylase] ligase